MDQASFCIVLRVPGMNCCSLWSLCHSVSPILYIVLIYLNIDTVWSHHRNIFFFISVHFVYLFCPLGLSAFWQYCEILLESFHWGAFIGHSMCVVKKGNACIKSVFGHSDSVATLCTFVISDELIFTVCIG